MTNSAEVFPPLENKWLKLPRRFEVIKIAQGEYKFLSLSNSMRVRISDQLDQSLEPVFEHVFDLLKQGCELREILDSVDTSANEYIRSMIEDLLARGLLQQEKIPKENRADNLTLDYAQQIQFFANFRPHLDAPPATGQFESADSPVQTQQQLKLSTVMIAGLGRTGSRLAKGLAYAGVGTLYGSDSTCIEAEDTIDSGYGSGDIGLPREQAIGKALRKINGGVNYGVVNCRVVNYSVPDKGNASVEVDDIKNIPDNLDLLVLCEDNFDPDRHAAINKLCLERKLPWISLRNMGLRVEVGPMIVPHETACFTCLSLRKTSNLEYHDRLMQNQREAVANGVNLGRLNLTLGYEILALEVIKILSKFSRPATYGNVLSFDLVTLETKLHPVLKIPRCPDCSKAAQNRPAFAIWNPDELFT